jgi:hypothetical protein
MKRGWLILILTILFGLGALLLLWSLSPWLILVPCAIGFLLFFAFIRAAELTTFDDWDLLIRSLLHRLGFQVQAPKSLMHDHDHDHDIDIEQPETWEEHHKHHHEHEEH